MRPHRLPLAALMVVATGVLATYFVNSPKAVIEFDSLNALGTPTYIGGARDLLNGHVFSTGRLPGYPLMLAALGAANGFYVAVIAAQSLMFLGVVALTYYMSWRVFGRRWIAFLIALLLATDLYAAAYAKEVLSESLALSLVTLTAAALVALVTELRTSMIWALAALATATTFTRPEWILLPLALALYGGIWAIRRGAARSTLIHGAAALAVCYGVVAVYVAGNALFNGYPGTSEINNISVLGKVMQYDMQLEAPAKYRSQAQIVNDYVNVTHLNVWHVVTENPQFATNHYELSGAFGRAVILSDPVRYFRMSAALALTQNASVDEPLLHVASNGPFKLPLHALARYTSARYAAYWLLPGLAALWALFPLFFKRRQNLDALGPIAVVALYGTLIVAFGGFDEYGRYHTVFLPATNLLVWGALLLNVEIAARVAAWLGAVTAALVLVELGAIVFLDRIQDAGWSALIAIVILVAQGAVLWLWSSRGQPAVAPVPR